MDGEKVALGNRGMTVEAAQQCAKDRKKRRAQINMSLNEFHAVILLGTVFFGPPSRALLWWLSPGEGRDAVT